MKKIPTIFKRNPENMRELLNEPNEKALWVFAGEGVATRKYDGTCCLIEGGKFYKRREVKKGKPIPANFTESEYDENTGKRFGWVPVDPDDPANQYHMEAYHKNKPDGTYELVGPKIQGNPEGYGGHILISHAAAEIIKDVPLDFKGLISVMIEKNIEGIVWKHPDGRQAKIKLKDFHIKRIPL